MMSKPVKAIALVAGCLAVAAYIEVEDSGVVASQALSSPNNFAFIVGMAAAILVTSGIVPAVWALWNISRGNVQWSAFPLWIVIACVISALMVFGAHQ